MQNNRLISSFKQSYHYVQISNPQQVKTLKLGEKWYIIVKTEYGKRYFIAREYDFVEVMEIG